MRRSRPAGATMSPRSWSAPRTWIAATGRCSIRRSEPRPGGRSAHLLAARGVLVAEVLRPDAVLLQERLQMRAVHLAPPRELDHRTAHLLQAALEKRLLRLVARGTLGVAERGRGRLAVAIASGGVRCGRGRRRGPEVLGQMLEVRGVPGQA